MVGHTQNQHWGGRGGRSGVQVILRYTGKSGLHEILWQEERKGWKVGENGRERREGRMAGNDGRGGRENGGEGGEKEGAEI